MALVDDYFELLEAFPQEMQRTATRVLCAPCELSLASVDGPKLMRPAERAARYWKARSEQIKEIDAASHRLLNDVSVGADALTHRLLDLSPSERDARLAQLHAKYASLLGFVEEKAATIGRAVAAADKAASRLESTLVQMEETLAEPAGADVDDGSAVGGAYYAGGTGAGYKQGMSSAAKQRSPGKPAGYGDGRASTAGAGALAALAGTAAAAGAAPVGKSSGGPGNSGGGGGGGGGGSSSGGGGGGGGAGSSGGGGSGSGTQMGPKRKGQGAEGGPSAPGTGISPPKKKQRYNPLASLEGLPIYKGKNPCPPLCGPNPAAPDYIMQKGDTVAARTSKPKDVPQEWILATVVRYYAGRQRYEVEDVEEDEGDGKQPGTRKKYTLSADAIIPMPKSLPDPAKNLEFGVGRTVLALYPGTTCFYEAQVLVPPSKRRKENDYLLQFVDDEESGAPQKAVPQAFVLNMPSNSGSSA